MTLRAQQGFSNHQLAGKHFTKHGEADRLARKDQAYLQLRFSYEGKRNRSIESL